MSDMSDGNSVDRIQVSKGTDSTDSVVGVAGLEERLARLEQQNERMLGLLEEIAASSFSYKGKKLPAQKPDFTKVETALKTALAAPELSALFALDGFEAKEWVAQVKLRHKVSDVRSDWAKIEGLVRTVRQECEIPGRVSGWYMDPNDAHHVLGDMLDFGYSTEVGYDHEHDFYTEHRKSMK